MRYTKLTSAALLLLSVSVQRSRAFFDTFTLNFKPLTIQRLDPLVSPGVESHHMHAVVGGNAFSRNMSTPTAATVASSTTCDKYIDRSNYWVPNLYHRRTDGLYDMVEWTGSVSRNLSVASSPRVLNIDSKRQSIIKIGRVITLLQRNTATSLKSLLHSQKASECWLEIPTGG